MTASQEPDGIGIRSPQSAIPHPLVAGIAWAIFMSLVSAGYLAVRYTWWRWICGVEDAAFISRDQWWSALMLASTGLAIGVIVAAVRRRRAAMNASR